jgi:hypothetical protein
VCTKSTGFNLEAACSDGSMVIMGIRVLLGSQDINRVPSYVQVSFFILIFLIPGVSNIKSHFSHFRYLDVQLT